MLLATARTNTTKGYITSWICLYCCTWRRVDEEVSVAPWLRFGVWGVRYTTSSKFVRDGQGQKRPPQVRNCTSTRAAFHSYIANDQQPANIHSSATNSMSGLFGDEDDEDIAEQNEEAEEEDDEEEEDDILDMGDDTGTENQDNHESLLMRFCPHDSSMLYPHENKESKTLEFACKLCQYTEPSRGQLLVYRNEKKKEVTNLLHTVPSAISDDPTLARSNKAHCTNCGHNEAVFFQSDVAQSDSLALIFVCCNCDHKWVG